MISKKISKKILILPIVLMCLIVVLMFINFRPNKDNINFQKATGVLIYTDWDAYIYSYSNNAINVQIPVYEFNNSLKNGYSVSIENYDIGKIDNIKLELKNKKQYYNQYILSFSMFTDKVGKYNLDKISITIEGDNNITYNSTLGEWVFEVEKSTEEKYLLISGGSSLSQWVYKPDKFFLEVKL